MKVLILSVTAGQGHHNCGAALRDTLISMGAECLMIDTLDQINSILKGSVEHGYLALIEYLPKAYGAGYRLAEKRNKSSSNHSPIQVTNKLLAKKIEDFILDYDPDAIVCTHSFPAQFITKIKGLRAKTYGIITDFTVHPFWDESNLDYYVTPSERLGYQLSKKGIPQDKMLPFGIPINIKFNKKLDKSEARKILGIEDKPTIFFISGSMGFGNMPRQIKTLKTLDMDFQVIAVSGRNEKMKKRIDNIAAKFPKKIYSYGFVDNIDVIMDASDFMVTKPGGLTVSEGLAKGLPLILVNPIPGQENRNVEFLLNNGLATLATSAFPADECVYQLMTNTVHHSNMLENIKAAGRGNAAERLAEFIFNPEGKDV